MSASDTAGALSCSGVCTIGKQPVNIPLTALQKKKFCAWECRGFPKTSGRKLSSPHAAQFIRARTRGRVMLTKYPAAFPVGQLVSQILTKYTLRYPECGLPCGSDAPASAADSFTAAFRIFLLFRTCFQTAFVGGLSSLPKQHAPAKWRPCRAGRMRPYRTGRPCAPDSPCRCRLGRRYGLPSVSAGISPPCPACRAPAA